jgi:hypothetical protein
MYRAIAALLLEETASTGRSVSVWHRQRSETIGFFPVFLLSTVDESINLLSHFGNCPPKRPPTVWKS